MGNGKFGTVTYHWKNEEREKTRQMLDMMYTFDEENKEEHIDGMLRQLDRNQGKVNLDAKEAAENASALDLVANGIFSETVKPRIEQFFKKFIPRLAKEITKVVEERLKETTGG